MAMDLGGIAQGIEAGARLSQSFQDRKERKEQHDREYGLQLADRAERKARAAVHDEREAADYGIKAADDIQKSTVSEFANIASQYGSFQNAPPEVQARARKRAEEADTAVTTSRKKRNEVAFGAPAQQELSDIITNLQTGRVNLEAIPDAKFHNAVGNALKRDPEDFLRGPKGEASTIDRAIGDITAGMEGNNPGMLVRGANVVLAPELRQGIGRPSPHGGTIIAKEIEQMVPHPNNPNLFSPMLRVYVDEGKDFKGPRGPHGATSSYLAPATEGQSSDPNAPVKFIDMAAALDRVGQLGTAVELLNHPEAREKLSRGGAEAGARTKELIDTYYAQGVAAMPKKQLTTTPIKLGDQTLLRTTDAQGKEVGRETLAHVKPVKERTFEVKLDSVDDALEAGEITAEEAAQEKKKIRSGIAPPKAGKAGGGGGAAKSGKVTEAETMGVVKGVNSAIAADLGIRMSPITKTWVTEDGKPAPAATIQKFNAASRAAETMVRDAAAKGVKVGMSPPLKAASEAAPAPTAGAKTVKWGDLK